MSPGEDPEEHPFTAIAPWPSNNACSLWRQPRPAEGNVATLPCRDCFSSHIVVVMRVYISALFFSCFALLPNGWSAGSPASPVAEAYDFAQPARLSATLYEIGSNRKKVLYTFQRTATRSGSTVNVDRQFQDTNGTVVAEEKIVYESGRLVSLQSQQFQMQASGSVRVSSDPKHPDRQKLLISFGPGLTAPAKANVENLPPDLVIDDTLYPFLLAHWDKVVRGESVKFQFVSLEWKRTFVFRLTKMGGSDTNNPAAVRIKMEAAGMFASRMVSPIIFTAEKNAPHLILSYVGRTTPRIQKNKVWRYLDAETVFNWEKTDVNADAGYP